MVKISKNEHLKQQLRIHPLLSDFELEDVWQFPFAFTSNQSLRLFVEHFNEVINKITGKGIAGFLFK